ncbi:MAG: helix-turn-helix domain-containing protein, partial [Nitrospirota bacterium]
MPKEYVHLSLLERDHITILRHDKKSMGDIAKSLGRSKSSISLEIKRNSSAEYNLYMSHRAHERSE